MSTILAAADAAPNLGRGSIRARTPKQGGMGVSYPSMRRLLAFLAAASLLTVASTSMAQNPVSASSPDRSSVAEGADDERCDANGGYCYKFLDDVLNDKGLDSTAPLIHVRPVGLRTTLIRPRTQFVSEMLRSVEAI